MALGYARLPTRTQALSRVERWTEARLSGDKVVVLIVASALIVCGVLAGLPRAARQGGSQGRHAAEHPRFDGLWTVLPIAFLVVLVIFAVKAAS